MLLSRGLRRGREKGAVAVEFALVFCFLLIPLVMGMLDYGWYFYSSQVTGSATRETARRLSVGDCATGTQALNHARAQSGFSTLNFNYGSTSALDGNLPAIGSTLRVESTVSGKLIGLIPLPNNGAITRTIDVRMEDATPDSPC